MGPALAATAREATSLVPVAQLAGQPGRHHPGGAPHSHRCPVRALGHRPQAGVTGQAPQRLGGQDTAVLGLGHALVPGQDRQGGVDDHGGPVGIGIVGQGGGAQPHQGVRTARLEGVEVGGGWVLGGLGGQAGQGLGHHLPLLGGQATGQAPVRPARAPGEAAAAMDLVGVVVGGGTSMAGQAAQLGGRVALGRFHQGHLGLRILTAQGGQGAELVPGQASLAQPGGQGGTGLQHMGHPHPLGGGGPGQAVAGHQPVSHGGGTVFFPRPSPVVVAHQEQQLGLGGHLGRLELVHGVHRLGGGSTGQVTRNHET